MQELLRLGRGFDSEVADQGVAQTAEDDQRVRLPVDPVERKGSQHPKPFAEGMLTGQRLKLGCSEIRLSQRQPHGERTLLQRD